MEEIRSMQLIGVDDLSYSYMQTNLTYQFWTLASKTDQLISELLSAS